MAAILSLQSCCHKLYPHTTEVTEKTESVTETIRDTVIMVQPDSSIMQALIQCDSTGRARLQEIKALKESARMQQTISMEPEPQPYKPTVITVKATVDSMGIYLSYRERYKEIAQIQKIRDHNRERSKCSEMVAETIYHPRNPLHLPGCNKNFSKIFDKMTDFSGSCAKPCVMICD